jgi:hypothetical protein
MSNHKRAAVGEAITMKNGRRRDDLKSNEDDSHVQANMEVIREYLCRQFKGFGLTEQPNAPLSYTFTMTRSSDEEYKLRFIPHSFQIEATPLKGLNNALSRTM